MSHAAGSRLDEARQLIDDFASRTGLTGDAGDPFRRYLWTDAFAVQTCFGLARELEAPRYRDIALALIERVHETLGRFHPDDERDGWISGLPDAEARQRPTAAGLRIGKPLPERAEGAAADERLEWEQDGQYFHYLTRWFAALTQAGEETGEEKYRRWAAELILAGGRFVHRHGGRPRMYWKMSTDLTRPLVASMGAHDPLEGLICSVSAHHALPALADELEPLVQAFTAMCAGQSWATTDALGIGGLLLATLRAAGLAAGSVELPAAAEPARLWSDAEHSLQLFAATHRHALPATQRLPFRECGLSLGLRAVGGARRYRNDVDLDLEALEHYLPLAGDLEDFWREDAHQRAATWTGHRDINTVTLAASLVAGPAPLVFG